MVDWQGASGVWQTYSPSVYHLITHGNEERRTWRKKQCPSQLYAPGQYRAVAHQEHTGSIQLCLQKKGPSPSPNSSHSSI